MKVETLLLGLAMCGALVGVGAELEGTGDYVIDVAAGQTKTIPEDLSIDRRVVKTGSGTLVLTGNNSFSQGVVVSNGTLRADDFTRNLGNTHLQIGSDRNDSPAFYAFDASTFTVPLGATAGTVEFPNGSFGGLHGLRADGLTVDFGGRGDAIVLGTSGYAGTDIHLRAAGGEVRLLNRFNLNGLNQTVFGWTNSRIVFAGGVTNTSDTSGSLFLRDTGAFSYPRPEDAAAYRLYRYYPFSGTHTFTDSTLMLGRIIVGDTYYQGGLTRVLLKDCVRIASVGSDVVNGAAGTELRVDGGSYTGKNEFIIGNNGSWNLEGTLAITNDAQVALDVLRVYKGRVVQRSGSLTVNSPTYVGDANNGNGSVEVNDGRVDFKNHVVLGSTAGGVGRMRVTGGTVWLNDKMDIQVGGSGTGELEQMGGSISFARYLSIARQSGSVGTVRLCGGVFTHRGTEGAVLVGEEGKGFLSVADGGYFKDERPKGALIGNVAKSRGLVMLSPDGTIEAGHFYGNNGESGLVFNGGTWKLFTKYEQGQLLTNVRRTTVTPLGGVIDTNGKGDFTVPQALTAATQADDLSETLTHRWRFESGLEDEVGNSSATVEGTVSWTNGAVRLAGTGNHTSCVNLGMNVLPTDGKGATIEMFVTLRELNAFSRLLNCGDRSGTGTEFYVAPCTETAQSVLSVYGGTTVRPPVGGFAYAAGGYYHVAVTFEPLVDGKWRISHIVHAPGTGENLMRVSLTMPASWSLAKIVQSAGCWLGRSNVSDKDPAIDYHDVRIYNRVLTESQLVVDAAAGCDRDYFFAKKGVGTLTLTGANSYSCGTAVEGGTLKLATGATLPTTPCRVDAGAVLDLSGTAQTVATLEGNGTARNGALTVQGTIRPGGRAAVGTLTLAGTTLVGGMLRMDVGADGAADLLAVTGALDITKLGLSVENPEMLNPEKSYTLMTAETIVGQTFGRCELPRGWRLAVDTTRVRLVHASGVVILVR